MISLGGLGTQLGIKLFEATRDKQIDLVARDALSARQISSFSERIGSIGSAKELIADTEVYTFVMRSFDLEDQIFGKALVRKTLESDISETNALVNRLTDPKIKAMYKTLGFEPGGGASESFGDLEWQSDMIARFKERLVLNNAAENNEGAGLALNFKSKASGINTWYDVLKDADLGKFMRRALSIPDAIIGVDVDRQAAIFAQKFDITKLKDPAEIDKLVSRFAAVYDVIEGISTQKSSAALTLMQNAVSAGQGGGISIITIDIPTIAKTGYNAYR
jgi:hypothetical protein